eukprot:TRINITY_DN681_c0_g1_i1.p1 TRINITY_DN681_c0_g1~~TRINITY_DN681_c0_g1_i1.p1  ORF type:complete len:204 (-),score=16.36 TRINITY_DN681_c0_g1_i1:68-610(-)
MNANGFSTQKAWSLFAFNAATWFWAIFLIVEYYSAEITPHLDLGILVNIMLTLAATDVAFFLSHRYLHQKLPELHRLHHCCRFPSFTTNLFFHPIDLSIEFSGPIILVWLINGIVFYDPFAMCLMFGVVLAWYACDHDEYVQTPHWVHHKFISSKYAVYTPYGSHDSKDRVKGMITFVKT